MLALEEGPGAAKAMLVAPTTADDFRNRRRLALFFIWQAYQDQQYIWPGLHDPAGLPDGAYLYYVETSLTVGSPGRCWTAWLDGAPRCMRMGDTASPDGEDVRKHHDRPNHLSLPNHRTTRLRRHGCGLQGRRHQSRSHRRSEVSSGTSARGRPAQAALLARGESGGIARSSEYLHGPRGRRSGRPGIPRDGIHRRARGAGEDQRASAETRRSAGHRDPGGRRVARGAREGRRASGYQELEPDADFDRPSEDHGLRPGAVHWRDPADQD